MTRYPLLPIVLFAAVLPLGSLAYAQNADDSTSTASFFQAMPTDTQAQAYQTADKFMAAGRERILETLQRIAPRGEDDDTSVRYLLDAAVLHVNREGAEAERNMLAQALATVIEQKKDKEVRAFLFEMLARTHPTRAREVLGRYAGSNTSGEDAVRSLLFLQDAEVAPILAEVLPRAQGRARSAILYGLGDLRAEQALSAISDVEVNTPEVRLARAYALASLAAPAAEDALKAAAAETTSAVAKSRVQFWKLLYAERLGEKGDTEKSARVIRELLTKAEPDDTQLRTAAWSALVRMQGDKALPEMLAALAEEDIKLRNGALQIAAAMEGANVTSQLVSTLEKVSTSSQAEILRALGNRGDQAALEGVRAKVKADDALVRAQAIGAAAKLGGSEVLPELLALSSSDEPEILEAVRQVLMQSAEQSITAAAAQALPAASEKGRVMLLELLASRNAVGHKEAVWEQASSPERAVRVAAIKALDALAPAEDLPRILQHLLAAKGEAERNATAKAYASVARRAPEGPERLQPLLSAYESASQPNKESILSSLAQFGGKEALDVVTRETSSTEPEVQTAAIRALSEWTDGDAMPYLLKLAESKNESHHVLALRGYLRLLDAEKGRDRQKFPEYKAALKLARREDERKTIITGLGDIRTTASLQVLAPFLHNENLANEASLAVAKVVLPGNRRQPGLHSVEASAALLTALPYLKEAETKKKAEKHINAVNYRIETSVPPADDEGFVSLFNGRDLTGWTGDLDGYKVEDGALVCIPEKGGNLFTERQFDNFVLKFEFKLEPASNNGLAVRSPLHGNPAFDAMELQILDNAAHPTLKAWQRHGSVYGVADAEDGHMKPHGEWNEQEVIARDGQITVKVNGATIVDANVWEVPTTGTQDGRPHPGLHRRQGHLGFLGHGSRIDVRNMRVRELINEVPEGFTALFNGKDLSGCKGLVANPIKRGEMPAEELKAAQDKADQEMRDHWQVLNGNLIFDGDGSHLCTTKDYGNFEMLVDWKIGPGGDSGIYLRGSPQVQIWDPAYWPEGSGGLYNNQKYTSSPLVVADRPIGEWNRFRIKMVGDKVTVHLNDKVVVDSVILENYWDRKRPIFPSEQLELQSHGSPAYFRNIFVREP